MTGIDSWSVTPATNATADGGSVNWAEGQTPSSVNNTARQQAADVRSAFNDIAWFQYGTGDQGAGNLAVPAVYSSATAFTITGANVTAAYHAGRPVRAVGVLTGTIYGAITSSSYNGGNSTTTVNVSWDSGSLSNETLVISLSQVPVTGTPVSGPIRFPATQVSSSGANVLDDYEEGTWTPSDASGAALVFTSVTGNYIKIGRMVYVWAAFTYPATGSGASALIGGLPFTALNSGPAESIGMMVYGGGSGLPGTFTYYYGGVAKNSTQITPRRNAGTGLLNSDIATYSVELSICYQATT